MKKAYISYILALLLFGSNGMIASCIALSGMEIVLYRTLLGALLLTFFFVSGKNKWTFYKKKKQSLYLLVSGIAMGLSWMFLYEAYDKIGVSVSSLLHYCGPVIVMLFAPVVFKEKLTVSKMAGFFFVLMGIILVNGKLINESNHLWGMFCGVMSAMMYVWLFLIKKRQKFQDLRILCCNWQLAV